VSCRFDLLFSIRARAWASSCTGAWASCRRTDHLNIFTSLQFILKLSMNPRGEPLVPVRKQPGLKDEAFIPILLIPIATTGTKAFFFNQ
jgi:hypothetical protein